MRPTQKHHQHFELSNWRIDTSNLLSTYRKINVLLTNSIYFVFFSLKNQRRLAQTKVHYKFLPLSEKQQLRNLQKEQLQETFSPVCMLLIELASITAFYSVITEGHSFLQHFIVILRFDPTAMLLNHILEYKTLTNI